MISEAAAKLYRAAIGRIKQREKDALARKHQVKIARVFKAQKAMVLDEMSKQQHLFSESYRKLAEESPVDFTLQNFDRIWERIAQESNLQLQEAIAAAEADGLVQGAEQLKRLFNSKTTFNLANPRAVQWFQQNGGSVDRIRGIQQTTGDQIKTIITKAIDNGWSYNQTAKEISQKFDGFSRQRAKKIAVYETAQAYEEGNRQFADALTADGIEMEKFYQTSEDGLVSELCQGNQDDGWIPIEETHSSGVQQPPGHVNCRCYELYREVPK